MVFNIKILIFTVFCILCSPKIFANHSDGKKYFTPEKVKAINEYIEKSMANNNIPGVAIALLEAGEIIQVKGFGIANSQGQPIKAQTPFQLASLTKTFTALIFAQLEQEGKLSLDDAVVKHIDWFKTAYEQQSNQMTIKNLLQHRSGFSRLDGNRNQNTTYRGKDATELAVRRLQSVNLHSMPGHQFEYSNANYQIASHLIEVIENKAFEEVMKERIFAPLEMNNSYVQISENHTVIAANGFPQWFGYPIEREFILGRMKMGDGGVASSAEDLAQYLLSIQLEESVVVNEKIRKRLFTVPKDNIGYALGWEVSELNGYTMMEHNGVNGGFHNYFGITNADLIKQQFGYVILSNSSSALNNQFVAHLRRFILDSTAPPKKANVVIIVQLIALYVSILLLILGIAVALIKPVKKPVTKRSYFTPVFLIVLWYVMAYMIPLMNNITLFSIYPFFPDLAVGLIATAVLSMILAVIKGLQIISRYRYYK